MTQNESIKLTRSFSWWTVRVQRLNVFRASCIQVKANLHSKPLSLKNLFFHSLRFMIGSNHGFSESTHWILPYRRAKILIKNLVFEKIEFEIQKGCYCRSALTCILEAMKTINRKYFIFVFCLLIGIMSRIFGKKLVLTLKWLVDLNLSRFEIKSRFVNATWIIFVPA